MLPFQSEILQNKQELRKFAKQKRKELFYSGALDRISKSITDNILQLEIYKCAKNVMIFYPLNGEINLLGLLEDTNKTFYFPKCIDENLAVCKHIGDFEVNKFNIKEPKCTPIEDLSRLDIIFVPSICADMSKYRLGFGFGYYDKFFAKNNLRAVKILPQAEELICKSLPKDNFDVPCDILINQYEIMK